MKEDALILFKKAEKDLNLAKYLNEEFIEGICFHCQQAVEKYLKAYLAYNNQEINKTHNIADILKDCEKLDIDFTELKKINIDDLTDYAVNVRYDEIPELTFNDAKEAIFIAEQVRLFIILKIPELLADKKIN
ncbi:MAG: HEPN domain-containing protein [bacterium]